MTAIGGSFRSNAVTVVRAATGAVLATLTGNGLNAPTDVAFDGQRILVVNSSGGTHVGTVSIWKAADMTFLGNFTTGSGSDPFAACSDGINFFVTVQQPISRLLRF